MVMKRTVGCCILALLFAVLLTSCQNDKIGALGQKFMDEIECSMDANGEAIIEIAALTDFGWDSMVAISTFCSETEKEKALGFKYSKPKGADDILVFLKDGKIVYEESFPALIEHPEKVYLFFEDRSSWYREFTPDDAKVLGRRFQDPGNGNGWCYVLRLDSKELSGKNMPDSRDRYPEAYLDILKANRLAITGEQYDELFRYGIDTGDGKIAALDVYGDEAPELLYIYVDEITNTIGTYTTIDYYLKMKILTYSEEEGVATVFDSVVYDAAGGEDKNYCIYLARDGELMGYVLDGGIVVFYGFWPIIAMKDLVNPECQEPYLSYENRDLAKLFYIETGLASQFGNEIPEEQFDKAGKEIMDGIDLVLFQGPVVPEDGLRLYKRQDFWKDVLPFEESCMTYVEAVAWLEEQMA